MNDKEEYYIGQIKLIDGLLLEETMEIHKKKLDKRIAIVTGATKGNGLAGVMGLAKHGAKVYMVDSDISVHERAHELRKQGYCVNGILLDVCDQYAVKVVLNEMVHEEGRIDILLNSVRFITLKSFMELSNTERDALFDETIKGVWNCSRAVYPYMLEKDYGKIINMSFAPELKEVDNIEPSYAIAKAAIWGFTQALAYEAARYGINVNAICPGHILTPSLQQCVLKSNPINPNKEIEKLATSIPLGRLGSMEEIGELVAFLASDEASYLVGTQIFIDGGSTLAENFNMAMC
ncbi:SDR family oxidoreductase [Clostridia bacterium]|nr:SDR family oxidoreductase [Clostridia bacterium]